MKCSELADRIQEMQPDASSRDVTRLCLLLSICSNDLTEMSDLKNLKSAWREMSLRLQAATDQHAAMTDELEVLANSDPKQFSSDQIWVLIRAIKVQSQILQLYVGEATVDI